MAKKTRILTIYLGAKEYGNEKMSKVAREAFTNDPTLDIVEVNEHGGWRLSYLRDGTIVGTANDTAVLSDKAKQFREQVTEVEYVGSIRRT